MIHNTIGTVVLAAAMAHVATWVYAGFEGYNADWPAERFARYATFAEFSEFDLQRLRAYKSAGGAHAVVYIDPSLVPYCIAPFLPPAGACRGPFGDQQPPESAWFHQADGQRVHRPDAYTGEFQEALNPASSATLAIVRERTLRIVRQAPVDLFFADDTGSSLTGGDGTAASGIFYGFPQPGSEITTDTAWIAAESELLMQLARPAILNGGDIATWLPSYHGAFLGSTNVAGASREGCFSTDAAGPMSSTYRHWQLTANALLAITHLQRYAVCMEVGTPTPRLRTYDYASWLLTYDNRWSVLAPIWSTSDHRNVFPEIALVTLKPQESASDDIGELNVGGAYVRHFADCAADGVDLGACAVAVNPNLTAVPLPASLKGYRSVLHLDTDTIDRRVAPSWGAWDAAGSLQPVSAVIVKVS